MLDKFVNENIFHSCPRCQALKAKKCKKTSARREQGGQAGRNEWSFPLMRECAVSTTGFLSGLFLTCLPHIADSGDLMLMQNCDQLAR